MMIPKVPLEVFLESESRPELLSRCPVFSCIKPGLKDEAEWKQDNSDDGEYEKD